MPKKKNFVPLSMGDSVGLTRSGRAFAFSNYAPQSPVFPPVVTAIAFPYLVASSNRNFSLALDASISQLDLTIIASPPLAIKNQFSALATNFTGMCINVDVTDSIVTPLLGSRDCHLSEIAVYSGVIDLEAGGNLLHVEEEVEHVNLDNEVCTKCVYVYMYVPFQSPATNSGNVKQASAKAAIAKAPSQPPSSAPNVESRDCSVINNGSGRAASTKSWTSLFWSVPRNAGVYSPIDFDIVEVDGEMVPPPEVIEVGSVYWSEFLVGFLIDSNPKYQDVKNLCRRLWKLQGDLSVIYDNSLFYFKFSSKEERQRFLMGEPNFIDVKPFIITTWSPSVVFA